MSEISFVLCLRQGLCLALRGRCCVNVEGWKSVLEGVRRAMAAVGQSLRHPPQSAPQWNLGIATSNLIATTMGSHCVRECESLQPQGMVSSLASAGGLASYLMPNSLCPSLPSIDGIYYGDNRFNTVSESGTATLKARPRVRPLLTFIPLVSMLTAQSLFQVGHLTCQKWSRCATSASPTVHSLPS